MPVPAPVAEVYMPCVSLDATIDTFDGKIEDGGFTVTQATDDMTNNKGAGWEEDVPTTKGADVDVKIAWNVSTGLVVGAMYKFLINVATFPADLTLALTPVVAGAPAFAGKIRILSCDAPVLNVKAGVHLSFKAKSQGLCAYLI